MHEYCFLEYFLGSYFALLTASFMQYPLLSLLINIFHLCVHRLDDGNLISQLHRQNLPPISNTDNALSELIMQINDVVHPLVIRIQSERTPAHLEATETRGQKPTREISSRFKLMRMIAWVAYFTTSSDEASLLVIGRAWCLVGLVNSGPALFSSAVAFSFPEKYVCSQMIKVSMCCVFST